MPETLPGRRAAAGCAKFLQKLQNLECYLVSKDRLACCKRHHQVIKKIYDSDGKLLYDSSSQDSGDESLITKGCANAENSQAAVGTHSKRICISEIFHTSFMAHTGSYSVVPDGRR